MRTASILGCILLCLGAWTATATATIHPDSLTLSAQAGIRTDSAAIQFRQSKTALDLRLGDNAKNLSEIIRRIHEANAAQGGGSLILNNIVVIGAASPEGPVAFNRMLSEKRAAVIFNYLAGKLQLPDSAAVKFHFLGRDWTGLQRSVEADLSVPYRDEVLALLSRSVTEEMTPQASDRLLAQLKSLRGGASYRYLYTRIFPALRKSRLYVQYEIPQNLVAELSPVGLAGVVPSLRERVSLPVVQIVPPASERELKPFYMALKTNLLSDIAALPHIGIEFYAGRNWSVGADWTYGWWKNDRTHRYWRGYGGELTVRKWVGAKAAEKPLTGQHLGIYGGLLTFDFEWGGRGYMGGRPKGSLWDRCMVNAGVEYGYSMPIARRLNIDFTVGVGYLGGKLAKYVPIDQCYVWQSTSNFHWFGPTKAEVSLVWLIGRGNVNKMKGGQR